MPTRRELMHHSAVLAGATLVGSWRGDLARAAEPLSSGRERFVPARATSDLPPAQATSDGIAEVNGAHFYYWDTGGDGEVILLEHAGTGSALAWPYQREVFAAQGYRVIGYSRRGYYRSGPIPEVAEAPGSDLLRFMDALALPRAHLIGTAAGGGNVARVAIAHPERVRTLTIACSVVGADADDYRAIMAALAIPGFAQLPAAFRELGPSCRAANPQGAARWLELEQMARSAPPREGGTAPPSPSWAQYGTIRAPTHLIYGDADLYSPPPVGRPFLRHIADSELTMIGESGHSAYWEQPNVFNEVALDFLKRRSHELQGQP